LCGLNHQTVATGFEVQTAKPEAICFEAKPGEIVATGFEVKLEKIIAVVLGTNH
jgi:hypothetical protein